MKCDRCGSEIEQGEEREHLNKVVCEDCYMDILSPTRTCDPWSTHSAKSLEKDTGDATPLTPTQTKILEILKATGGSDEQYLLEELGGTQDIAELKRELSSLRHMEKVGGKRKGDQLIWQLWE